MTPSVSRLRVIAAFLAIYVIWGSTYLAIRFAVETLPPLLMAGSRFLVCGVVLYAWARAHGAARPLRVHWKSAAVVGVFLLVGGNGGVSVAEQRVPSGLAALLVASSPLWMVVLDWLRGDSRPRWGVVVGLAIGFLGVAVLVEPFAIFGGGRVDPVGAVILLLASLSWAWGSLYARRARLPESSLLSTAMEMLAGGALLLALGLAAGESGRLYLARVSVRSLLALGYLMLFGSLVGFSAYIWLLRVVSVASVSTYAYVNPVVAVLLGCAIAREPLTPRVVLAAFAIVVGVVLIIANRGPRAPSSAAGSRLLR